MSVLHQMDIIQRIPLVNKFCLAYSWITFEQSILSLIKRDMNEQLYHLLFVKDGQLQFKTFQIYSRIQIMHTLRNTNLF